jgi:hypothetical protein
MSLFLCIYPVLQFLVDENYFGHFKWGRCLGTTPVFMLQDTTPHIRHRLASDIAARRLISLV